MPAKSLPVGRVYTRLTVRCPGPDFIRDDGRRQSTSICDCACGNTPIVLNSSLKRGLTKSCGCLRSDSGYARHLKHGLSHSRAYGNWSNRVQRCTNPNNPRFNDYGGRGITVCSGWRSFENFLEDMGEGKAGWTIERVDNDGNYSCGTVRRMYRTKLADELRMGHSNSPIEKLTPQRSNYRAR